MRVVAMAAALTILPMLTIAKAQDDRSLTDFESRIGKTKTQVSVSDSNTIGALREKLLLAETTISALTATVAEMGNSAEASRRQLEDANSRLEALAATEKNSRTDALEARLLQCLRELRLIKSDKDAARQQLLMLSEAIQMLLLTTADTNPQALLAVESELRKTSEVLGGNVSSQEKKAVPSLTQGLVLDTRDELSLVVVNLGRAHGVKIGMPFQVFRNNELISAIKIVDVRDKISGGVIQSLTSETIRIEKGDTVKVDAQK
jgi:septal ring factor EnvC (AmiA/AmiB activator)